MKSTFSSNGVPPKSVVKETRQRLLSQLVNTTDRVTGRAMRWLEPKIREWEKKPLARRKQQAIGVMAGLTLLLSVNVYLTLHRSKRTNGLKAQASSLERLYEGARQRWQSMPQNHP